MIGRAPRARASAFESGIVATDGEKSVIESGSGISEIEKPVDRFTRLWEPDVPVPDVFAFLASYPDISIADRLWVLLADQRMRWMRGQPLPLRVYLSAYPEIAERGELIRALVDGERQGRRKSAGRLNETIPDPNPDALHSETPTEAVDPPARQGLAGGEGDVEHTAVPPTGPILVPPGLLRTTKLPGEGNPTGDGEELLFDLDEGHHLRSEAESLRTMLDAVRFTLVRRLGTGGMGVVFEAYDQKRGELVALKTMRRVDASALVRFKQEFRSLADITHPNLVNLYELFAVEDRWFFTMELVEGTDFVNYVRSRRARCRRGCLRETRRLGGDRTEDRDRTEEAREGSSPDSSRSGLPPPSFDEDRLRDATAPASRGCRGPASVGEAAPGHQADERPGDPEGRVVLLDFGLTADLESSGRHRTSDRQIVGTVAPHVAGAGGRAVHHGGQRLVQRRGHALRGDDGPVAVRRAAPGDRSSPSRPAAPITPSELVDGPAGRPGSAVRRVARSESVREANGPPHHRPADRAGSRVRGRRPSRAARCP